MVRKKRSTGPFFKFYRFLFMYGRYALLDVPMLFLIWLYLRHFLTQGAEPVPTWFVYFYWGELTMYVPVKEDIHSRFEQVRTRWGVFRPALWVMLLMFFAGMQSRFAADYASLPPLVAETTFVTIGVWVLGKFIAPKRAIAQFRSLLDKWASMVEASKR